MCLKLACLVLGEASKKRGLDSSGSAQDLRRREVIERRLLDAHRGVVLVQLEACSPQELLTDGRVL